MATSVLKRTTTLAKSSESCDDSSYSTRRSIPRRHRSLSRFSHRTPDPDPDATPMRKGKFVNTVRGSGFGEISLDDLAVEFFESFSSESGLSSSERGRSGSRKSSGGGGGVGDVTHSQRRGRSVSRAGSSGNGGLRRLDADTESSRRRRSLSRNPSTREIAGKSGGLDPGRSISSRRRSVSRQPPRERVNSGENAIRGRAIGADRGKENSRRQRSLSVVRRRIDNSESDGDQVQHSSNSRDLKKSVMSGKSLNGGSGKPAASDHRQGPRRSLSQNPIKYHDGYSSHSSAVTDDEGKESSSIKHGAERIIRTVYAQNKVTPKKRESLGNSEYGSQRKSHDDDHHAAISTFTKGYATKLQESEERKRDLLAEIMLEERRGRELSTNLKELLIENSSEADEKPSRTRKRSKDRSRRSSMCLTDEAEQFIDEFISNIEDTDFSSFEDEKSESSSSFGLVKSQSSQSTTVPKSVPVEMDGVMLPWLQWETPDDTYAALTCLNKSPHTPNAKPFVWESDPTQDGSSGQGTSNGTMSSRGSWSPYESATKTVSPIRRLKIDVSEYLKRPNSADILNETWKLRHRISSGSLVLSSRSLI
ncbi:hypothetical protein HID58_010473 [Brassica napus]|uniref:(rape) hypothetical protein n=1 Tax=Brassica napus TaxID=3708 RepID=A0A816WEN3_BRANA|nr:uncharacterized protein LOC106388423 [Brassica napus]KAH0933356.1 hypothetical protein HID58_010473 [Brassica napus]CAF2124814.1 unnamed protein product [Brassica napus]